MPKTSLDFVFFYDVNQNLKKRRFLRFPPFMHLREPLRKQKVVVRDLRLVDFDPFCVLLCSKVRCFVFEKHRKFYLSSKIFFIFFTLTHVKFRFQRWNCSYRASKSRGNTATEGLKRTGTFPLTLIFADKHSGCYGDGVIDVAEKFEFGACSIWIVEDVGRGSFLFPTYLGGSKETLFAGYSEARLPVQGHYARCASGVSAKIW